ncbi:hypothetical protein [Allokutzneria sp. NRRL B-24872]|uniref:hypothetical protein n=1 Tax=Allokutzneria sp. NRRL B-24872 TaxID=1137961 RepID=UPI000A37AC5B|nr:hypothetical protein [Allokutzneria sp. NRRL B-24872]
MNDYGRPAGVCGRPLLVQFLLLVAGVFAGWALTGEKSTGLPVGIRMDYLVKPLTSNPIIDMVLAFGALLLVAALLMEALTTPELDRRWYPLLLVALAIGGYLGHAARIIAAGGVWLNMGAIFVAVIELPMIMFVTSVLVQRTWLLIREPESGADRHPARSPLRSQAHLLACGAVAAWWLVGDLSVTPEPGADLDYLVQPLPYVSMSPAIDVLLGSVALALAAATLLVTAITAERGRWLAQFFGALVLGGLLGGFGRVLTAGGSGVDLGAAVVLLAGPPLLVAGAVALGWRTTRLRRAETELLGV